MAKQMYTQGSFPFYSDKRRGLYSVHKRILEHTKMIRGIVLGQTLLAMLVPLQQIQLDFLPEEILSNTMPSVNGKYIFHHLKKKKKSFKIF